MFLGMLNEDERRAFVVLSRQMINADDIVVGAEAEALATMREELGLAPEDAAEERDTAKLAQVFRTKRAKTAALLELIGLGYSDSKFSISERSMVAVVAHEMGVSTDELAKLDQWVKTHVSHIAAAMRMMEE